jgi:predicted nucleic acid-binding protein
VSVLVDTSVWSLALRRDTPERTREVETLAAVLEAGEVVLIGCVLQELLQGFPARDRTQRLVDHLAPFPLLALHRGDYIFAAEIRNKCRTKGIAVTTIDAQIAAASINHRCRLLTADQDFTRISKLFPIRFA